MTIERMSRRCLLLGGITVMLWLAAIPVRAEQTEKTVTNQTVETMQGNEAIQIEDVTGLDDEFEALEEESIFIVEEVEHYHKEEKRKRVQRIVAIMLCGAILGVGVVTGLREKRKNDTVLTDQEEDKTEEVTGGQT